MTRLEFEDAINALKEGKKLDKNMSVNPLADYLDAIGMFT